MNGVTFILDPSTGNAGPDGMPAPGGPPDIVERMIKGEVEVEGDGFTVVGRETPKPGPAPSAEEIARAEVTRSGSQFAPPFGQGAAIGPTHESGDIPGEPKPWGPSDEIYDDIERPDVVPGSKYTPPFTRAHTLDELRDVMNTPRSIVEGKRVRSASPCRTCKFGLEHFGIADVKSSSHAHIARRIACNLFDADMTTQTILRCGGYSADPDKVASFKTIRQIEAELRAQYGLTPPSAAAFDADDLAEEEAFTKRALEWDPAKTPVRAVPAETKLW